MAKYVRIPLQVEAYQYKVNASEEEKASLVRWLQSTGVVIGYRFNNSSLTIKMNRERVSVWHEQWIIHGALDEIYAIIDDEFQAYYTPVVDRNPPTVEILSTEE